MYSTFYVSISECMSCNNEVLKTIGTIQGVFGAEIDRIDGKITISHTDEVSRDNLALKLDQLGWKEISPAENRINGDEPSIWGCAL